MRIKKLKMILIVLMGMLSLCFSLQTIEAATCPAITEDMITTYFAVDYSSVPYCSSGRNLQQQGCYPLTIASILSSYGENVSPSDVSTYLCSNFYSEANSVSYGNIMTSSAFQNNFSMKIEAINQNIESIDAALNANKMVLASINNHSIFTSGTHYIAIAKKFSDNDYYIINTGSKYTLSITSKHYTKDEVMRNVVGSIHNGLWSVEPTNCSNTGSSGGTGEDSSSGRVDDPFPDYFPKLEQDDIETCTLFLDRNGNKTEFGEFVDGTFTFIKIATPVIVVVLTTIDYIKALAASNADALKKTNKRTMIRLIVGFIIFFLPYLLELLFYLFGLYDLSTCGIGT